MTNRDEMDRALTAKKTFQPWKRDELLAALEKAVVPAGPINTIADLFEDPQFKARGMRDRVTAGNALGLRESDPR